MFEHTTLSSLDIAFFGGSLAITVLIGLYFSNKNKTFADYARGGGNQNIWAVSASMAAGYCSALTLIGNPSELYMHGTSFTLKMATTIVAWPISSFVFLPVFKRLDGISIFQYIENRFNPWLRRFVSLLFIAQMTFYSAISLYLPSLPLYATLKVPQSISVGLIGAICIIYCSFGGIKAVTWSNLYHTILLLCTMMTIIIAGTIQSGGPARLLSESYNHGRFSLGANYFKLDLTTRHTIYNTLLGYTLVRLFLHGTSQMQVQSALSLSSMRKSQTSQLLSAIFYFIIQVLASTIGLILFVNYKDCDPHLSGEIQRQDELLMHYIHKNLSSIPIMQGMFIAAIFCSTLTTMSSFQNSTSAMVVEDFLKPLCLHWSGKKLDERLSALLGKCTAIVLGTTCVLLTFQMSKISGLQQATTTLYGVIGIPILSAFALGTTTQFVNTRGMFAGMLAAILFGLYVFWGHVNAPALEPSLPISTGNCPITAASNFQLTTKSSQLFQRKQMSQTSSSRLNATASQVVGTSEDLDDPLVVINFVRDVDLTQQHALGGQSNFNFAHMSYLWLPVFTMSISVIVASLVSLLTGGARQQIDAKHLAPLKNKTRRRLASSYAAHLKRIKSPSLTIDKSRFAHTNGAFSPICERCCCACNCHDLLAAAAAAAVAAASGQDHPQPSTKDDGKSPGVVIVAIRYPSQRVD